MLGLTLRTQMESNEKEAASGEDTWNPILSTNWNNQDTTWASQEGTLFSEIWSSFCQIFEDS